MTNTIHRLARAVAAACLAGAVTLGSSAAEAERWELAQAAAAMTPSGNATPATPEPAGQAEARITDLHTKLQITNAEEPPFTALADVIRANARSMQALLTERQKDTDRTAVGSLRWYERLTEAHAVALKQFVPAFEALYAALSDGQRTTADAIFQRFAQPPPPRKLK